MGKTLKSIAAGLTALAIDLEHADAAPTTGQHDLLNHEAARLEQVMSDD